MLTENLPKASYSSDLFALGRVVHYTMSFGSWEVFYPKIDINDINETVKMKYLVDSGLPLYQDDDVKSRPLARVMNALLRRDPASRASYSHILRIIDALDETDGSVEIETISDDDNADNILTEKRTLLGQYRLENPVGKGRFGLIWKAIDLETQLLVALKFSTEAEAFEREVNMLRTANEHPNIVTMIDVFERDQSSDHYPYYIIVMPVGEYSLQEHARFQRPFRLAKTKDIMQDIVSGIEALHSRDIIHCDLKPPNIVMFRGIDGIDRWKLVDFDSSVKLNEAVRRSTFDYCAPEVIKAYRKGNIPVATTAIDVFALGRILQWMASNEGCFWPGLDEAATDAEKENYLLKPGEIFIDEHDLAHRPTKNLVLSMLRKDPEQRLTIEVLKVSI